MKAALALLVLLSSSALADDRASCDKGDKKACARIGRLKQLGALKADGTRDDDALIATCTKALDNGVFTDVARRCGPLFNPELQRAWDALGAMGGGSGVDKMLGTGYAEAYCPSFVKPVAGCNGKRAANFSSMKPDAVRAALSALNAAALDQEIGADKAKPLAAKFDGAWAKLFAK
jgi:hypothetical protein